MSEERQERMQVLRARVEARQREEQRVQDIEEEIKALQFILEEKARFAHYLGHLENVQFIAYYNLKPVIGGSTDLFNRLFGSQANLLNVLSGYPNLVMTSRTWDDTYSPEFLHGPTDHLTEAWLHLCLKRFGLDDEYYLAFGRYMDLIGWARIRVSGNGAWLSQLFKDKDVGYSQFAILSDDLQRVFALVHWEQEYLVQIRQLSQVDNIKRAYGDDSYNQVTRNESS